MPRLGNGALPHWLAAELPRARRPDRTPPLLKDDDLGKVLFGDSDIFHCAYIFAGIIQALERHTGKRVREDSSIFEMAVDQLQDFAEVVPNTGLIGIGRMVGGTGEIFDLAAVRALKAKGRESARKCVGQQVTSASAHPDPGNYAIPSSPIKSPADVA